MTWSLLQFPAFTHLSHPPFATSVYLIHFVWLIERKNRIATARRKPIKPFAELLTSLLLLWTRKNQAIRVFLLCPLDSQNWWTQSLQTMPITTVWRSDDKVMVWAILQNKSPFCQEESIYFFHLILSLSISYHAQIFSLKRYRRCIFLGTLGPHWNQEMLLAPDDNFSHSVASISGETLVWTSI